MAEKQQEQQQEQQERALIREPRVGARWLYHPIDITTKRPHDDLYPLELEVIQLTHEGRVAVTQFVSVTRKTGYIQWERASWHSVQEWGWLTLMECQSNRELYGGEEWYEVSPRLQ